MKFENIVMTYRSDCAFPELTSSSADSFTVLLSSLVSGVTTCIESPAVVPAENGKGLGEHPIISSSESSSIARVLFLLRRVLRGEVRLLLLFLFFLSLMVAIFDSKQTTIRSSIPIP